YATKTPVTTHCSCPASPATPPATGCGQPSTRFSQPGACPASRHTHPDGNRPCTSEKQGSSHTLHKPQEIAGFAFNTYRRIGMPTEAIGICEPTLTEHPFGRGVAWRMAGQPTAHSALSLVTRSCAVTSSSGPDSAHTGAHASGAVPYFPGV